MKTPFRAFVSFLLILLLSYPQEVSSSCTAGACSRQAVITAKKSGSILVDYDGMVAINPEKNEPPLPEGTTKYNANFGQVYQVTIRHTGSNCQAGTIDLSANCSTVIFSRESRKKASDESRIFTGWAIGKAASSSSDVKRSTANPGSGTGNPGTGGGDGGVAKPHCGETECVGGTSCRCQCYQKGGPSEPKFKYTGYFECIERDVTTRFQELMEDPEMPLTFEAAAGKIQGEYQDFKSWKPQSMTMYRRPALGEDGPRVEYDTSEKPADVAEGRAEFHRWDEEGKHEEKQPDIPTKYCECPSPEEGGDVGGGNSGAPGGSSPQPISVTCEPGEDVIVEIIAWRPPNFAGGSQPGGSISSGPGSGSGGGGGGGGGGTVVNPKVAETSIIMGLGQGLGGMSTAWLEYNSQIDAADPLADSNFQLKQIFGSHFVFNPSPAVMVQGANLRVDKSRGPNSLILAFIELNGGVETLVAAHQLLRVDPKIVQPNRLDAGPGIVHLVTKNGQTIKNAYYGRTDTSGGRIWREEAPDGTITEGVEVPYANQTPGTPSAPNSRYEQRTVFKVVEEQEVLINSYTKRYALYAWGEALIEDTERTVNELGAEIESTTSYGYYHEDIAGEAGRLKWRLENDGNWVKYEYNTNTGALHRTFRPWLSSVTHPDQASYENSVVTTHAHRNPSNTWDFESINGQVTSRTWNMEERTNTDPLLSATAWAHGTPVWRAPALRVPLEGGGEESLRDNRLSGGRLVVYFTGGYAQVVTLSSTRVSEALNSILGQGQVRYDAIKDEYEIRGIDNFEGQGQNNRDFKTAGISSMALEKYDQLSPAVSGSVEITCSGHTHGLVVTPPSYSFDYQIFTLGYWITESLNDLGGYFQVFGTGEQIFVPHGSNLTISKIDGQMLWGTVEERVQTLTGFYPGVISYSINGNKAMLHFSGAIPANAFSVSPAFNRAYEVAYGNLGADAVHHWVRKASSRWKAFSPEIDVSQLGDEVLTDLMFGWDARNHKVQRSQTFTTDYGHWSGQMSVYVMAENGVTEDALKYSVSPDGRVTFYNHQAGIYDSSTETFNWAQTQAGGLPAQARKTTTSTFACNPMNLQLLAEDPVKSVTMQDYDGRTRVEETWKGDDLIKRVVHDYDAPTGELISTMEDSTTTFSAERDTAANNYTTMSGDGQESVTQYTTDGRVDWTKKVGHGGRADIVSRTVEGGLTTTSYTEAGGLRRKSSTTVNTLGQTVASTDEEGRTTTYSYEDHGRRVTEHLPNGGTRITQRHLDGRVKAVTGTAVIPEFHDYEVTEQGDIVETVYLNDDGTGTVRSPRWRKTWTNGIGQVVKEAVPAPGGASMLVTTHEYNTRGQRVASRVAGQPARRFTYDAFGRQSAEGVDLDNDGKLDLDQTEPVTQTKTEVVQIAGSWWEKTTVTELANAATGAPVRTRSTRRLLSGSLYNVTVTEDSDGLVITDLTVRDPATKTVTQTRTSNRSGLSAVQVTVNGLLMQAGSLEGTGLTSYDYDALERPTVTLGADGIAHKTVYADVADPEDAAFTLARQRVQKVQVRPVGATDFTDWESYTYHPDGGPGAGQVHVTTRADASTVTQLYDVHGRQTLVSGTGTYPLRYEYNGFGELWKMHTFRSGSPTPTSVGDVTTWDRDPASGALMSKTDALNHGTTHAYEPATGRLLSRTWARTTSPLPLGEGQGEGSVRVKATYGYDGAGRLETITYNDGTPGVTHTYHPDGRPKTTLDAAGLHTYLYAGPNGALSGETISGGLLAGAVISYGHDAQKRRDQVMWSWGSGQSRTTGLTFDAAGRLHTVTAFGQTATYGYEAGTGRLDTLAYTGTGSLTGSWDYDERGRLDVVSWQRGVDTVSRHDYGYATDMNRRTTALRETGDEWRYGYNLRGEVESAAKAQGTAANALLWKGLINGYGYDGIGNRTTETVDTPTGTQTLDWTPNAVNQITEREVARGKWVLGRVHPEATLTAKKDGVDLPNGSVVREGENFAVPTEAGLTAGEPAWKELSIHASRAGVGKNGGAVQQTQTGSLWFAASPESLSYDDDGNLQTDGRWLYLWDAENRLKAVETQASAIAAGVPAMRLEFAYDAMGRRVQKVVKTFSSSAWVITSDLRYLYDGWNLIAEFEKSPSLPLSQSPRLVRAYAWGRDLSGTQQGAGGVGGLVLTQSLSSNRNPPSSSTLAPTYDGNGNITAYLDLANGRVIARLDYDAFGKPVWSELSSTVGAGERIPFGFSTKYEDHETGLLYYGYRYYAPELGRWLNEDPIEENGGVNLYGMVGNDAVNRLDYLGLAAFMLSAKPNCEVILRFSHGPRSSSTWRNTWLSSVWKLAKDSGVSQGLLENKDVPFYGAAAVMACETPEMQFFWIPGVTGNAPGCFVGFDNNPFTQGSVNYTNGGFGSEMHDRFRYIEESWSATLDHAYDLADKCAEDECCQCKEITAIFEADSNAVGRDGTTALNSYKKNASKSEAARYRIPKSGEKQTFKVKK